MKLPKPLTSDEIATISEYLMKASYIADNLVTVIKFVDISVGTKIKDVRRYSPWSEDLIQQISVANAMLNNAVALLDDISARELS